MINWMQGATWSPLFPVSEMNNLVSGEPRILVFHTMDGFFDGSMNEWKSNGVNGVSPHFNVAGKWDAGSHADGFINQIRPIDKEAAAQWDGNDYCTSIETSDGSGFDPGNAPPWTFAQIKSLIKIATWWSMSTGVPARLVQSPSESGYGYHQQFSSWNQSNHNCPGANRVAQLTGTIIPLIQGNQDVTFTDADRVLLHECLNRISLVEQSLSMAQTKTATDRLPMPTAPYTYWHSMLKVQDLLTEILGKLQ